MSIENQNYDIWDKLSDFINDFVDKNFKLSQEDIRASINNQATPNIEARNKAFETMQQALQNIITREGDNVFENSDSKVTAFKQEIIKAFWETKNQNNAAENKVEKQSFVPHLNRGNRSIVGGPNPPSSGRRNDANINETGGPNEPGYGAPTTSPGRPPVTSKSKPRVFGGDNRPPETSHGNVPPYGPEVVNDSAPPAPPTNNNTPKGPTYKTDKVEKQSFVPHLNRGNRSIVGGPNPPSSGRRNDANINETGGPNEPGYGAPTTSPGRPPVTSKSKPRVFGGDNRPPETSHGNVPPYGPEVVNDSAPPAPPTNNNTPKGPTYKTDKVEKQSFGVRFEGDGQGWGVDYDSTSTSENETQAGSTPAEETVETYSLKSGSKPSIYQGEASARDIAHEDNGAEQSEPNPNPVTDKPDVAKKQTYSSEQMIDNVIQQGLDSGVGVEELNKCVHQINSLSKQAFMGSAITEDKER